MNQAEEARSNPNEGTLAELLGGRPVREFLAENYLKLPYSNVGGCRGWQRFGNWEALDSLFAAEGIDGLVVRRGARSEAPFPRSAAEAQALTAEGCTVLVRHAERHNPELAQAAKGLARELGGAVNVHIYATPAEQFGFGWHYDAEEVFILQTTGRKEYRLRKNTVHPWPLEETLPEDMRYEREIMPLMRCVLEAGDWLYIPAGYWHMAEAEEEAISLAVGITSPAALGLLNVLRPRLADSILWRQRLPAAALTEAELREHLRQVLADLRTDLARQLTSEELLEAWMAQLRGELGG